MLKANFTITETGGTGLIQLQYSSDTGTTWHDIGDTLTLTSGTLTIDDSADFNIDTEVLVPGTSYIFRLIDTAGEPVSEHITLSVPAVKDYTTGTGQIDFDNAGGDNWTVTFYSAPLAYQHISPHTITGYSCKVKYWESGHQTVLLNSQFSADHSISVGGNGAGVYELECKYNEGGKMLFALKRIVKVDAAGNVIADIQLNGVTINSVSDLTINATAHIIQTGVNYDIQWITTNDSDGNLVATTATANVHLNTDTVYVLAGVHIDADNVFTDDFGADPIMAFAVEIV